MEKITSISLLKQKIVMLEIQQANELIILKEQGKATYESIKPINLIKNGIKELASEPNLKGDLVNTALSLATGYLSKKVIIGSTHNPIKQLLGNFLQAGVSSLVSKNADEIKSVVYSLLKNIISKKQKNKSIFT